MQRLLDALRAQGVPVQTMGLAMQSWLFDTNLRLNPLDPAHMAHQLELEDTRAFFLRAYGERYDKWEPDYYELEQEKAEAEKSDEDE